MSLWDFWDFEGILVLTVEGLMLVGMIVGIVIMIAMWKLMRSLQSIANSIEIGVADLMDRLEVTQKVQADTETD